MGGGSTNSWGLVVCPQPMRREGQERGVASQVGGVQCIEKVWIGRDKSGCGTGWR